MLLGQARTPHCMAPTVCGGTGSYICRLRSLPVVSPSSCRRWRQVGLVLLVVEAGLEVDVGTLRQIGLRGMGTSMLSGLFGAFPLAIGFAKALGMSTASAVAIGICLCPSSSGVALTVRTH